MLPAPPASGRAGIPAWERDPGTAWQGSWADPRRVCGSGAAMCHPCSRGQRAAQGPGKGVRNPSRSRAFPRLPWGRMDKPAGVQPCPWGAQGRSGGGAAPGWLRSGAPHQRDLLLRAGSAGLRPSRRAQLPAPGAQRQLGVVLPLLGSAPGFNSSRGEPKIFWGGWAAHAGSIPSLAARWKEGSPSLSEPPQHEAITAPLKCGCWLKSNPCGDGEEQQPSL